MKFINDLLEFDAFSIFVLVFGSFFLVIITNVFILPFISDDPKNYYVMNQNDKYCLYANIEWKGDRIIKCSENLDDLIIIRDKVIAISK